MKKEYTYDYVNGTDVYLYQKKGMFRINTDTALLAHFMRIEKGERVLDIGTNNGALLAVAAKYAPSMLYGVEIQDEAAKLAKYNMEHLGIENAIILSGDVRNMSLEKVDVVICNPPYFKTEEDSHINLSYELATARHETYLTLDELCKKVSEVLQEKGRFYMVHRANRICDIIEALRRHRLEPKSMQFVYDEAKEEAISVLVEACKDGKANLHVLTPKMIKR